jgi:hypothetical protein
MVAVHTPLIATENIGKSYSSFIIFFERERTLRRIDNGSAFFRCEGRLLRCDSDDSVKKNENSIKGRGGWKKLILFQNENGE